MIQMGKPEDLHVEYTNSQIDEFWRSRDAKNGGAHSTEITYVSSVDPFWQKARKRSWQRKNSAQWRRLMGDRGASDAPHSALSFPDLEKLVQDAITEADQWKDKHHGDTSSASSIGRAMTKFLVDFQGYCQAFSGIAHLMDGLSYGSSAAAADVLSVLMMVAVNKQGIEEGLDSIICTLKKEYARIGRLKQIYAGANMQDHVTTVYQLGINMLKEATVYYSYSSRRRFWYVLRRPPSIDLDGRLSEIRHAISELIEERDTLDRERLNRVESKIDSQIEDNAAMNAAARLERITEALGVPHVSALSELRSYERLIEDTFSRVRRLPPLDDRDIFRSTEYTAWKDAPRAFLLIQGKTEAPHNTSLAWISQAAIATVRHLREEEATVVWSFCRPEDHSGHETSNSQDPRLAGPLTLVSLGYRLLEATTAGRHAMAACPTPEFITLQGVARIAGSVFAAYNEPHNQPRLMQCTEAAVDFLRGCIALVDSHGFSEGSQEPRPPLHFIVDRFDVLPLLDTALLKPLMSIQNDETRVEVKTLVVGERKLRDQKGGDTLADFIDDHTGKLGFGILELNQKP